MDREPRHNRTPIVARLTRRLLPASWAALVVLLAPAAANAGITIRNLDTSGAPTIRVTVVTHTPALHAPHVLENGATVAGLTAVNLGSDKNIVLAVDHSQSMYGRSLTDAANAARRFIALGRARDHFAIVTFASQTTVLASFDQAASPPAHSTASPSTPIRHDTLRRRRPRLVAPRRRRHRRPRTRPGHRRAGDDQPRNPRWRDPSRPPGTRLRLPGRNRVDQLLPRPAEAPRLKNRRHLPRRPL